MLIVKPRGAFAVWILGVVTVGIYTLVWIAKMCAEVQNVNPQGQKNVSGANAILSMFFGAFTLMIWPIINWFKFCESVRHEQQAVGLAPTFNAGVATLLYFLAGTHVCYIQAQQNLVVQAVQQRQGMPVAQ